MNGPMLPDGRGLSAVTVETYSGLCIPIHLRLSSLDGRFAQAACGLRPGELWTGLAAQVTCPGCLEVVHA